eukprot:TRINITY_DN793_c0_g1_i1.p1 TRINITY_DN793_c0_g1~~TRINITY_DN793_c0_g1_i1.p1  ORF type:complete len:111 (-),score=32.09 TRINITY_DN793_c0_g1_i1:142-474(-)
MAFRRTSPATKALLLVGAIVAATFGSSAFVPPSKPSASLVGAAGLAPALLAAGPAHASVNQFRDFNPGEITGEQNYLILFFFLGFVSLAKAVFDKGGAGSINEAIFGKDS